MRDRPPQPLFDLLPLHHRNRDAEAGRPLEALTALLAEELNIVERDIDQLYDNWFIETCEPWVVPYIAALVGARGLQDIGAGEAGVRSFIANMLGYRQAKGTAAVLEQMARDVTGWPVVAVEFFQRLIWSQNLNHVRPEALGTASIRDAEAARAAHGPFEHACHSAAAGPARDWAGRYNIPHVGLFVWRLDSYPLGFVSSQPNGYLGGPMPRATTLGPGLRTFDPLGADRPLYNRPKRDASIAGRADERTVPAPLDRRRLHIDLNRLHAGQAGGGRWFDDLPVVRVRLDGATLAPDKLFACNLETRSDGAGGLTWTRPANPGEILFDPELGRLSLHPSDQGKSLETTYAYAAPFDIGGGPYDRSESVAAWDGDFFLDGEAPPWRIGVSRRVEDRTSDPDQGGVVVTSLAQALQRWNAAASTGMRGIITILDNASYPARPPSRPLLVRVPAGARLAIVAASWPLEDFPGGVVRRAARKISPLHRRPHILANIWVTGQAGGVGGRLVLDGLLIEGEIQVQSGNLGKLEIRHCTVGAAAAGLMKGVTVRGGNESLAVSLHHSIVGSLQLNKAAGGAGIFDSIVGEDRSAGENATTLPIVVDAGAANLDLARSTIFGRCRVRVIEAENSLLLGPAEASHRQEGCVRFCFAPLASHVPRRYRCVPDLPVEAESARLGRPLTLAEKAQVESGSRPRFTSSAYPASAFGQLQLNCSEAIRSGAYGGAEMGAGFLLREPFRRANLDDALQEYLPFGLEAVPLFMS